jgi:UPF0148 protein
MKSEDEIMAEYLLKGGKMLSKTCPSCGCPLFDYKGETLCVVCSEEQAGLKEKKTQGREKAGLAKRSEQPAKAGTGKASDLVNTMEETLASLAIRVRDEPDPEQILILMNAIKRGIEARNLLL